ncbi:MAG: hypothetical protein OER04_16380 [Cyclobacteriaceae bacterium]|nr:hypothetical protein [Cyclobacteriaceae bacterium]
MKRLLIYTVLVFIALAATCSQEKESTLTADAANLYTIEKEGGLKVQ